MRTRCTKNVYYLSKGITVCSRWDSSFKDFLLDMGERPAGCTIDRIDGNKGYEPGNCRWATAKQQAQNRPGWVCTAAEIAEICGRFEHGENRASIGRRVNRNKSTVNRVLKDNKLWP